MPASPALSLASASEAGQLAAGLSSFAATADGDRVRAALSDRPGDLARLMRAAEDTGIQPADYQVRAPNLDDAYFALAAR